MPEYASTLHAYKNVIEVDTAALTRRQIASDTTKRLSSVYIMADHTSTSTAVSGTAGNPGSATSYQEAKGSYSGGGESNGEHDARPADNTWYSRLSVPRTTSDVYSSAAQRLRPTPDRGTELEYYSLPTLPTLPPLNRLVTTPIIAAAVTAAADTVNSVPAEATAAASASTKLTYIQRGTGNVEAFNRLFSTGQMRPTSIGMVNYSQAATELGLEAGFFVEGKAGFASPLYPQKMNTMRLFAGGGAAAEEVLSRHGVKMDIRRAMDWCPNARGTILTYGGGARSPVPYSGIYASKYPNSVVFINPQYEVWGVTPSLPYNAPNGLYEEGAASVIGPGHPVNKSHPSKILGTAGRLVYALDYGTAGVIIVTQCSGHDGEGAAGLWSAVGFLLAAQAIKATPPPVTYGLLAYGAIVAYPLYRLSKRDALMEAQERNREGQWQFVNNNWLWTGRSAFPPYAPPSMPLSAALSGIRPADYFASRYGEDPNYLVLTGQIPYLTWHRLGRSPHESGESGA